MQLSAPNFRTLVVLGTLLGCNAQPPVVPPTITQARAAYHVVEADMASGTSQASSREIELVGRGLQLDIASLQALGEDSVPNASAFHLLFRYAQQRGYVAEQGGISILPIMLYADINTAIQQLEAAIGTVLGRYEDLVVGPVKLLSLLGSCREYAIENLDDPQRQCAFLCCDIAGLGWGLSDLAGGQQEGYFENELTVHCPSVHPKDDKCGWVFSQQ